MNRSTEVNRMIERKIEKYELEGKYAEALWNTKESFVEREDLDDSVDFTASCIQNEMFEENPDLIEY